MNLSWRGARLVLLCRSEERGEAAAREIRSATGGEVSVHQLDLASLESVRQCAGRLAAQLDKIDILINNAGIMMCPEMRTADGFEMQIGTNHFGHFLLTNLLLPLLRKAAPGARIVTVSSVAHKRGRIDFDDINFEKRPYNPRDAYGQSKLANILFTKVLAEKLKGEGINTYVLHPGVINTELGRHLKDTFGPVVGGSVKVFSCLVKTPEAGSRTTIYCAVDESLKGQTGLYYSDCAPKVPEPQATNMEDAKKLWDLSELLVGMKN